jgi:type II secretory pathway component PulF
MLEIDTRTQHMAVMWRKFMRLTRGRVPALRALEVISDEETDTEIKALVSHLGENMETGVTLSEAAEKYGKLISPSVLELLRHAEKTGAWDEILEEIAGGLEDGTFSV